MKGWLDNYNDSKASATEGFQGDGFSNVGRNYSPAWGGQFQTGGSLPGATGNMYARVGAPSNGPYAKKTLASAQNGVDIYKNPMLARRVDNPNINRSYYDPKLNTMNIGTDYDTWRDEVTGELLTGDDLKYHQDKLLAHENYHAIQHSQDRDNYDIAHNTENEQWARMQKRPQMMTTNSVWNNFYNRSNFENEQDYQEMINIYPESRILNQNLLFDKVLDRQRYDNPANLEGEAKFYENTGVDLGKQSEISLNPEKFQNGGEMSYYQHGLDWKPKGMENGGWLNKYDEAQTGGSWEKQQGRMKAERDKKLKYLLANKPEFKKKTINDKIAERLRQDKTVSTAKDATAVRNYNDADKHSNVARNKTDKEIITQRKADIAKGNNAKLNQFSTDILDPSNLTRQNMADAASGLGDKFRLFPNDAHSFIDDYLNPAVMIGGMASNLGQAPLQAQQSDSYLPYLTSIGAPLVTGALGGIGAKTTGQFVNNLVNPLAGLEYNPKLFTKLNSELDDMALSKINNYMSKRTPAESLQKELEPYISRVGEPNISREEEVFRNVMGHEYRNAKELENTKFFDQQGNIIENPNLPIETPSVSNETLSTPQKAGFPNLLGIVDRVVPRPPTPGMLFGIEDSWNNYSPLNLIPGYGKKLSSSGTRNFVGFRKFGNSINDVIESQSLRPKGTGMGSKQITSEGNWAEPGKVNENYSGVFEATMNPNVEGSNIKLEKWRNRNGIVGTTNQGDVAIPLTDSGLSFNRRLPFSNRYIPINKEKLINNQFQFATQLPHLQSLVEKYGLWAGLAGGAGYISGGSEGAKENINTLNKYSINPVINQSKKFLDNNPEIENTYDSIENNLIKARDYITNYKQGGIIKDDRGQWAHPGEITEIGSNNITMQGVPYDVLGISDEGDTKLMKPGKNYKFKGKKVTEFPMAKNGVNQQDEKTLQHLDQLTNFTNYNTKQPGGWLDKYN